MEAGGRQEKVTPGAVVVVDRMQADPGAEVTFDKVLLVENDGAVVTGKPYLAGAQVTGVVEAQTQALLADQVAGRGAHVLERELDLPEGPAEGTGHGGSGQIGVGRVIAHVAADHRLHFGQMARGVGTVVAAGEHAQQLDDAIADGLEL